MAERILVTGATGYVGGRLVPRLRAQGYPVRCLVRRPGALAGRPWADAGIEIAIGDVLQPDTLPPAMQGIDVAYYLVHAMAAGERHFVERDLHGAESFARAAKASGIRRIIYLGALGGGPEGGQATLSPHLRSRQLTGDTLRRFGPPCTEFRAAIVIGSGSISFEMIRYLVERLPVMVTPKWAATRCQPIGIRDVLRYLVDALHQPQSEGRVLEIGGADVVTYGDMMRIYARLRRLKRLIVPVPVLSPRLSSYWVDLVTPVPASLARPLIEGLRSEVIVRDPVARALFPFEPMSCEAATRLAIERTERQEVETVWSMALSSLARSDARGDPLRQREGMFIEPVKAVARTPARAVFDVLTSLGGDQGWFAYDWAWTLRALADRFVGGIGMRRGRRHPHQLVAGEALDFWRVEAIEPDRLLRLRAEMRMPGKAWLQFEIFPGIDDDKVEVRQTALFEPKGLLGLLYWYTLYPIHHLIFRRMLQAIIERAEAPSPSS